MLSVAEHRACIGSFYTRLRLCNKDFLQQRGAADEFFVNLFKEKSKNNFTVRYLVKYQRLEINI